MKQKKRKKRTLKDDVLFKAFFSRKGNEEFLIDFLNAILKIEIHKIKIREEVNVEQLSKEEKGGRLDLQAEINDGTIVSIELQMKNEGNIIDRTESYGSNVKARNTQSGKDYTELKDVIMINILNYVMFPKYKDYCLDTALVLRQHRECEIENGIQYYFIELPKFRKKNKDMNNKLEQWLTFIDATDKEAMKMAITKNKVLQKAEAEYTYLTGDEAQRRLEELRVKWEIDRRSAIDYAEKRGEKRGERRGIELGQREEKEEIAKEMLKQGLPIEQIMTITKLTKEEIENLK